MRLVIIFFFFSLLLFFPPSVILYCTPGLGTVSASLESPSGVLGIHPLPSQSPPERISCGEEHTAKPKSKDMHDSANFPIPAAENRKKIGAGVGNFKLIFFWLC